MIDPEIIKLIVRIGTPIAVLYMVWFHWDELANFFRKALRVKQPWEIKHQFICPSCGYKQDTMCGPCESCSCETHRREV